GYICQSGRFLKMFLLIVGPGDNGKTRLSKLIEFVIGLDAISFDKLSGMNEEGSRFASSRLVGKLVVIDDDAEHEYLLPDGFLKKIAEEKPMTAERKFQNEFTFRAQVVVILLSNSWPRLRDLSRGLRTRAQVLYLPRSFKRPDECLPDDPDRQRSELWERVYGEEMPGVVNLLVRGFYRIKERGGLLPPKSAKDAVDEWFANANVVSRFLADTCEKVSAEKSGPTMTSLSAAFQLWADRNHVQAAHRPQLRAMSARLEALGFKVSHTNTGSRVFGLRIKPEGGQENESLEVIGGGADASAIPMVVGRAREQPEEICDLV
ncbi:MAG: phage/plasmid primase, P4 family, partial [Armatimonadota bacterium]